jgi:pSer/pThr/pTyr-binding forkhead associated (FHA) protein
MPKSFLVVQRGNEIGTKVVLKHGQTSLGRNPDNDIVVNEVAVSRYHALLRFNEKTGEVSIMDLGSTNGVTVNSTEIKSGIAFALRQRDTIFVGRAVFNLQIRPDNSPSADLPPVAEEDQDRTLRFNMPVHYNHQTRRLSS